MERKIIELWADAVRHAMPADKPESPTVIAYPVEGSRGAMIVCPGGAYQYKADYEGAPIAERLNEFGISAFVLDYRVLPCSSYAPLSDAQRAIRVVRSLGYEKVGIMGFSAGGHLSACAATMYDLGDPCAVDPIERLSCRPDAFAPCYGLLSMMEGETHEGCTCEFLGELAADTGVRRSFSPYLNVTSFTPPAFIWHSWGDDLVPATHSLRLAAALQDKGVPYSLHVYEKGCHGMGLANGVEDIGEWPILCAHWLLSHGFGTDK